MTIFVDASALVAIIRYEPEADALISALEKHDTRIISGLALWETARAIAKAGLGELEEAWQLCERYRRAFDIAMVTIDLAETMEAFRAHARYGKGMGHPAQLNMGDCFAYACARTNHAKLLYKGDDFSKTDLA